VSESFAAGLVGIVLDGRYRLDALVGEGGMGAVFRAHHLAMDRRVAVKLLKPHLTTDQTALQRFAREARSTMRVDSEHAVKVLDFGVTPHNDYYIVLEYLDGRTVQRELEIDGAFEPARVVHIAKQALDALGAAHKSGLVHRDIKPDNILLMRVGNDPDYVKMLDFGVAKLMEGAARSTKSALSITQAGMVFGTPEFMSPEQACGQALDGRSDLYSLAATMFAMLTGCGMYRANSVIEWLTHHARTPPPHLAEGAPALAQYTELDQVLQTCLAKSRDARPQTADEMIRMLAAVEHTLKTPEHRLPAQARSAFSPSSYVEAIDPNATLVPGQPQVSDAFAKTMMSGESIGLANTMHTTGVTPKTGRSGLWLVLGTLVIAGVIGAAIMVAMRKQSRDVTPPLAAKRVEPVSIDAGVDAAAVIDAAPSDAAIDAAVAAPARITQHEPRTSSEVAALIAAAEDAKRTGNHLRQIAKADAALRADPRNTRARFLLGDGLIASGDLDRGCKYLRDLKKNTTALTRARQAGCPTD